MTDEERFLAVLDEVYALLLQLGDLKDKAVLIGGHVIALHALARHQSAAIQTTTETGVTVTRGFTHEPDLLFDLEADEFTAERLPEVLNARGYRRHRDFRWGREVPGGVLVEIDLFRSPELDELTAPLSMTPLADAETVLRRTESLSIPLAGLETQWRVPDAFGFLTMKVRAKREQRPTKAKDCFDIYVFVKLVGLEVVSAVRSTAPDQASALKRQLRELFWDISSPGVVDVLRESGLSDQQERDLLARDVVDLFAQLD
jgi:hypothetical protein